MRRLEEAANLADVIDLEYIAAALVGGSLAILGLYLGLKLSRFRPHRKSQEVQALFSRKTLDE